MSSFECPICLEFYDDSTNLPTSFPCGHSCCLKHTVDMMICHACRAKLPDSLTVNVAFRDGAIEHVEMMRKLKEMSLAMASLTTVPPAPDLAPAPAISPHLTEPVPALPVPPPTQVPLTEAPETIADSIPVLPVAAPLDTSSIASSSSSPAVDEPLPSVESEGEEKPEEVPHVDNTSDAVINPNDDTQVACNKRSRKKKKKAAVKHSAEPLPTSESDEPDLQEPVANSAVAECAEYRSPVPSTVALAGGIENAMAMLVRAGVMSPSGAKLTLRALNTFCRTLATLPSIKSHSVYCSADMVNLKLLLKDTIGGWIFCGQIVASFPGRHKLGSTSVRMRDENGGECCMTFRGSLSLVPNTILCGSYLSICPLGDYAVDFGRDATMLVPTYPDDVVHILSSQSIADIQELCKMIRSERMNFCWGCGGTGAHGTCQKCTVAKYCSRNCQMADWRLHKKVCSDARMVKEMVDHAML